MESYKILKQLRIDAYERKHGHPPNLRLFPKEFDVKKPRTAAMLEALICELLERSGSVATKVYTGGRSLVSKTMVKDVTGRSRAITEQKWIPGTTERGTSDIIAHYNKMTYYLEVKFSKSDRQSEYQKKFEQKVIKAGAVYMIIRNLDDVLEVLK